MIKCKKNAIRLGLTVFISCLLFVGCNIINNKLGLRDDNVIEELVEEMIEVKTGIDVDLTPHSNEQTSE